MTAPHEVLGSLRLGFVGGGAMGAALAGGVLRAGVPTVQVRAADPDVARRRWLESELGIAAHAENTALLSESDVLVLAVKPAQVARVLAELARAGERECARPLWVSIAAGVTLAKLAAALPARARVVRAMPNTPALVGAGAAAVAANAACSERDRASARALFACVGVVWEAPDEALLDAVTGLSGSGPAYVFALLEALVTAGAQQGLPRDAAKLLATQTVFGAAKLASESTRSARELREQVSSPGGTTLAGLAELTRAGFGESITKAVTAATARSKELGEES